MSDIQGLREQIIANTKYLPLPDPPRPKQKTSPAYELVISRITAPAGISVTSTRAPSTTNTIDTATAPTSYKALLLTSPNEGAHLRIEGPAAETMDAALQGMLEVTARMVEVEMKRRGAEMIKGDEILDSREELGPGVLVVMRVPDEEMEREMAGEERGGEQNGEEGDGVAGKVEGGKRGPGRPKKAEGGGGTASASAAGAGAGGAAVDGEGRVVKRGRGRPKKNAG